MLLRLGMIGGALVARSARAFTRPALARGITIKRTDWAMTYGPQGQELIVCRGTTEDRLAELGYELPPASAPKGSYAMYSRAGNVLYLAGHIPVRPDGSISTGVVGKNLKMAQGSDAAKLCGLALLRTLSDAVGLDNVKHVHKVVAFVACSDDFENQPGVVNGCSDLLFEVLGDRGRHARSAVGTNALPLGVPVEIEAIVEVAPGAICK